MFTDTHCHLYKEYYDDINIILEEAENNNINRSIVAGCDSVSNKKVIELVNNYDNIYGNLGIHPENVDEYKESDIEFIKDNLDNKKIIGIGEIGLDYHYTKENKENQIKLFETQLQIAQDLDIPVVIHSREATQDTIDILKKYKVKGVIHSFSGSLEVAKIYIKMGFVLGINGVITFKNSNLKEVVKEIGLKNIILETDSPYLTPHPYRGKQNSPKYILDIAKFISELYNVSLEELSKITNDNIKRIFDI